MTPENASSDVKLLTAALILVAQEIREAARAATHGPGQFPHAPFEKRLQENLELLQNLNASE